MSIQPFHLLRVLLLLFIFTQFPLSSRSCNDHERNALLSFKSNLSDPTGRLSSWQVGRNCCNWHGIQCSNFSGSLHVTTLDLRNTKLEIYFNSSDYYYSKFSDDKYQDYYFSLMPPTQLYGTLPSSLFSLTHLEYLDLSFNDFDYSKISHQFANLSKLTHLDLSYSEFKDSITTQFTNLSSLRYLDVSSVINDNFDFQYNKLQASTNWWRGLVNLQVLKLNGVDLSSTTNWADPISYLSNLRELDLSYCDISVSLPVGEFLNHSRLWSLKMSSKCSEISQLVNLTSLSVLDLSHCSLQGPIPYLPQLEELYLYYNPASKQDIISMSKRQWPKLNTLSIRSPWPSYPSVSGSLPTSMLNLSHLRYLYLSRNRIAGNLPSSISNLSQLEYLYLDSNNITGGFPSLISNLKNLKVLSLNENNITGYFPSSISNLKNLKVLSLIRNNLQGSIPESLICEIPTLQLLHLTGNNLTGPIPSCITKFPNLPNFEMKSLVLSSCNLKGYIPPSICNFTHLDTLDLSNNNLKGAIPPCLFEIQTLVHLDMSQNNLQGTLPQSLQHNLRIFNLSNNNLQGFLPLPPEIIMMFDLSQNSLTGEITSEIGARFSSARYISLSGNKLSGSIPSSICSLIVHPQPFDDTHGFEFLEQYFDLSNNQITGTIPSSLGYCTRLFSLHLGMNNLIGNIPNELKNATHLHYLLLNDNNLNGTFPSFICQLKYLEILNLQNNNFVGSIPTFVGSLGWLRVLSLKSNKFNGSIPKEIMYLPELHILDLSRNSFSGPIPKNIGNLSMLKDIYDATYISDDVGSGSIHYIGDVLQMVIKGIMTHFGTVHGYNSGIDLSHNILEGNIPEDMDLLQGLFMLNLSHNCFSGKIPTNVGNMTALESLDLSFNQLSGEIPQSLVSIDNLGILNLSYNNLSGRIPGARHFETLSIDGSAYIGNPLLCGVPTNKPCEGDPTPSGSNDVPSSTLPDDDDQDDDPMWKWVFYGVVVLGYGVGFWGLFFVLLLRREKWWFGYWRVVDNVAARILGFVS